MDWKFITPGATWQGGIYERMFGVVKRSLRRTTGSTRGERLIEGKNYNRDNATINTENLQTKELTHQYTTACKRLDKLWKVWREEYLEELVLLKADYLRNIWKMGRVQRLIRGKDGICRPAVVRIASGSGLVRTVGISIPWGSPTENKIKKIVRLGSVAEMSEEDQRNVISLF
ncbi:unnamed protein product [Onchocerca ochengi]|uniref:DUF5641 domain-containing protein n=1 Tax=Onchocerca ochengi TaxID=42157 RepID=A0A182ER62_ONCOC|nr:unnamed protein product [Onchocerca ochengi]